MKLTLLRNATLLVEHGPNRLLVDPMLGALGSLPPFAFLRHRAKRNPTVPLPENAASHLEGLTGCVLTHFRRGHVDHLDRAGVQLLAARELEIFCGDEDARALRRRGLRTVVVGLADQPFAGGTIRCVPAQHGHGWISRAMGCGNGYLLRFADGPSLYLSGDTVLTAAVRETLERDRPDVVVVHAGGSSVDVGQPILMSLEEVDQVVTAATGRVVAVHLEALNHCPVTRAALAEHLSGRQLRDRVDIPLDGETLEFSRPSG